MKRLVSMTLVVVLAMSVGCEKKGPPPGASVANDSKVMTAAMVESLMESMESAARQRSAQGVMAFLSDDFVATVTAQTPMGNKTTRMSKGQYCEMLQQGWAATSDYRFERKNTNIKIAEDGGTAIVTDEEHEWMKVGGKAIHGVTNEMTNVALKDGKLQVVSVVGVVVSMDGDVGQ